jgi:polysaccharide deacetylase family protein (PEP-CTERM system associated)
MSHRMLGRLSPDEFAQELRESRRVLEDISGQEVIGYRAPTFSITCRTAWALDVLAEARFLYDSSVFPVRHDRYGVPDAPRQPHMAIGPGGGRIMELPPLTRRILGANVPVGGGGYLRLLPVGLLAGALSKAGAAGVPGMVYLHPWELDPQQPVLPMNRLSRFRHRVNLGRTESKLRCLMSQFVFADVRSSLAQLRQIAAQREHAYQPHTTER